MGRHTNAWSGMAGLSHPGYTLSGLQEQSWVRGMKLASLCSWSGGFSECWVRRLDPGTGEALCTVLRYLISAKRWGSQHCALPSADKSSQPTLGVFFSFFKAHPRRRLKYFEYKKGVYFYAFRESVDAT